MLRYIVVGTMYIPVVYVPNTWLLVQVFECCVGTWQVHQSREPKLSHFRLIFVERNYFQVNRLLQQQVHQISSEPIK